MPNAAARTTSGSFARPQRRSGDARDGEHKDAGDFAKRIVESSMGGIASTPSLAAFQLPLQHSATVTYAAIVRSRCPERNSRDRIRSAVVSVRSKCELFDDGSTGKGAEPGFEVVAKQSERRPSGLGGEQTY